MDLFVIDTPLQLLNAMEARHHFSIGPSYLLILKWNFWPKTAFERLLKAMDWKEISWIEMDANKPNFGESLLHPYIVDRLNEYVWTWRQYIRRLTLEKTLKCYGSVDRLVAGSLINLGYMCHVVDFVPSTEIIAVDDGTYTLDVAAMRRNGVEADSEIKPSGYIKSIKRFVRERYVEWQTQQPRSIRFFTAYDVAFGPVDHMVANRYDWIKSRITTGSTNGHIYFLGQPLIEDGYLDESTYFDYLNRISQYFSGSSIYYLPHKRESARTAELVEKRIKLPVKRFNEPIEVALALGTSMPAFLASFHSSALASCAKIFGAAFKKIAFYLPPESLLCAHESVEISYSYFREQQNDSFRVVELK